MRTILKYMYVLCMLLLLGGCVKDDTVDKFKELNKVSLDALQEKYSVMLYNYLKIPLTVQTSQNDESHLSYMWYLYTTTTRDEADTLSREKDLNVLIDPSHATPGEDYTLTVKVTDETTGVYYRKEMKLEVTTQFTKGTVLLCNEDGEAELNFLTTDSERKLIENIYSRANGGKVVGKNPRRIFSVNPNAYASQMKQELIFCQDENGGMIGNPVSFEAMKTMRSAFATDLGGGDLNPQLYFKGRMIDYIIINGVVCKRAVNMQILDWDAPLVCTQGAGDYEVAPFVMEVDGVQTFYDRKHKRLLQHYRWNMGGLHQMDTEGADLSKFDCNNMGENMEMECCGKLSEENSFWMLMRNSQTQKLYVYKFRISDDKFISVLRTEVTPQVAPHIYNAVSFAANNDFSDILMYAVGKQVYSLSLNMLDGNTSSLLEAPQVDLTDKNMEITGLKFVTINIETDAPGVTRPSMQLRLCVKDLNRTTLKGGVVFYEVNSQGGIHSDFLFSKTGFCDEVVDIDEKYS